MDRGGSGQRNEKALNSVTGLSVEHMDVDHGLYQGRSSSTPAGIDNGCMAGARLKCFGRPMPSLNHFDSLARGEPITSLPSPMRGCQSRSLFMECEKAASRVLSFHWGMERSMGVVGPTLGRALSM